MTWISSKPSFMTGLHYLNQIQYHAKSYGEKQMLNRRLEFSKSLYSKDLFAHYGCVNALEFSINGEWLVSGGDDKRVLLWNIDKTLSGSYSPQGMKGEHNSNIFCLGFNNSHSKIFSGGNDEQVILHDATTGEVLDVFFHDDAVYGLSVDPVNDNVFASACDDGHILIWDIRQGSRAFKDPFTLAKCTSAYHAVMYNPAEPKFLATANAKDGVCMWDVRNPKVHYMRYGPAILSQSAMSVCFNSMGTQLLALRRRFPPVLYDIASTDPVAEFDHQEYYNSCTMKTCCFAGDQDQYILSGSDDFKLYAWKVPQITRDGEWVKKAHFVLRGHRSIVNQVRYNKSLGLLASSGVEKIVKLWSSFPLSYREDWSSYVSSKDQLRKVYSHEEYINLVLEGGQAMTHDYSSHSVQEDQRMMAFFDSLVQRDIEGWTSSDSNDAPESVDSCFVVRSSDSSSDSSSSSEDEIPKIDAPNGICAITRDGPPNTVHSPPALSVSLPYITKRALESQNGDDSPDPSLDMISMLIAQKRRQQLAKAALAAKGIKKPKKQRKGCWFSKNCTLKQPGTTGNSTERNTSHRLPHKFLKTVRRVVMSKKRPLLLVVGKKERSTDSEASGSGQCTGQCNGICTQNTVDSGEASDESEVSPPPVKKGKLIISIRAAPRSTPNNASSAAISKSVKDNVNGVAPPALSSANSANASINKDDPPVSSSNSVNTNIDPPALSSSNSVNDNVDPPASSSSNSVVSFTTKCGKHKGRNYRKKGADDENDK